MEGKVIDYGKEGDSIVRPLQGGKFVILVEHSQNPPLDVVVSYWVLRKGPGKADFGKLLVQETSLAHLLQCITETWQDGIEQTVRSGTNTSFYQGIHRIKQLPPERSKQTALRQLAWCQLQKSRLGDYVFTQKYEELIFHYRNVVAFLTERPLQS